MTRVKDNRNRIKDVVSEMQPAQSTNVEAGIRLGYEESAEGHREGATNRVVLLSDALANTGETEAEGILKKIDSARREYGITLFGVGVGSDYGDAFMEQRSPTRATATRRTSVTRRRPARSSSTSSPPTWRSGPATPRPRWRSLTGRP